MGLGISEEHVALQAAARRWAEARCDRSVPRALLDAADEALPPFWDDLRGMGWLGLHVEERHGGEGYGLAELGIVLEELGRAVAPGPFLPTVLASAVIAEHGTEEQRETWLPSLASGDLTAALGIGASPLTATRDGDGLVVEGTSRPVLGAGLADVILLPAGDDWVVVRRGEVDVDPLPSLDATRRAGEVRVASELLGPDRIVRGDVSSIAASLIGAECVGGAAWCVETAASYAKVREQFGRPIGQFQAVKHRCADMLCGLELARAAVWDALRGGSGDELALAGAVAGALARDAFFSCAKDCIQVLGGIGFTWEHDAHLYLKRAMALRQLLGPASAWRPKVTELARRGVRRQMGVDLPPEAADHRAEVRAFLAGVRDHDKSEWRRVIADAGYLVPHWPRPWGREAAPLEQLVIDEEFRTARVRRDHLAVGAWVLPTLIAHATPEQQERWIPPTLRGEIAWCQMFSEPGAGSDLASLSTKATRVDEDGAGWLLTGQKVWTSMAAQADFAICLARTEPNAPKHDGITCFVLDMRSDGIEVRPLRELTGHEMFNEVFLSDAFVPDDCVIGAVNDGWRTARTTLENERVSMGSGSSFGFGVEALLGLAPDDDPVVTDRLGALIAEAQSLAILGLRMTLRALSGAEAGPESSVRKLLGVEHDQVVQEVGLELLGAEGATTDGDAATWVAGFLGNRCLTIAGGTSEIQRNVIAERLLGLPKDP